MQLVRARTSITRAGTKITRVGTSITPAGIKTTSAGTRITRTGYLCREKAKQRGWDTRKKQECYIWYMSVNAVGVLPNSK